MSLKIKANILNFISVRKNNKQYTCSEGKEASAASVFDSFETTWNSIPVLQNPVFLSIFDLSAFSHFGTRSQVRRLKWARTFTYVNEVKSSTVLFYSGKNHCSRICLCNRLLFYSKKRRKLIVELLFGSSVAMYL